jgi:hypothetical protein
MLPGADEDRPMTFDEAAEYLRLSQFGYADPIRTLELWIRESRIQCIHVGRNPAFNLRLLRQYASKDFVGIKRKAS